MYCCQSNPFSCNDVLTNAWIASPGQLPASAAGPLNKMLLQLLLPDMGPVTQSLTHQRRVALQSLEFVPQSNHGRSANKTPLLATPIMTVGLLLSSCQIMMHLLPPITMHSFSDMKMMLQRPSDNTQAQLCGLHHRCHLAPSHQASAFMSYSILA